MCLAKVPLTGNLKFEINIMVDCLIYLFQTYGLQVLLQYDNV